MLPAILVVMTLMPYAAFASCTAGTHVDGNTDNFLKMKGSCQTYQKDLPDGSLGFCNGIVDYEYFQPFGTDQAYLDRTAGEKATNDNPDNALLLAILPKECSTALKRAVCLGVFQKCELVDPYFLDVNCGGGGGVCSKCGTFSNPITKFTPAQLTPSYGSKCSASGNAASLCIVGPGKAPGMGNMKWADAYTSDGATNGMEAYCAQWHLQYDPADGGCKVAFASTPCKSDMCDPLWSTDVGFDTTTKQKNSVCPMISGDFSTTIPGLMFLYSMDAAIVEQLNNSLQVQTALGQSSIPLLAAFKINPNCSDSFGGSAFDFSVTYAGESVSSNRASSLGLLMASRAAAYGGAGGQCESVMGPLNFSSGVEQPVLVEPANHNNCTNLAAFTARCFAGGSTVNANPSVRFVDVDGTEVDPTCKTFIREMNQPDATTLQGFQAVYGLSSTDAAKGAFFVPPLPGLPVLAYGKQDTPLCVYDNVVGNGQTFTGYDAYECMVAKVASAVNLVPPFLTERCRKAYMTVLCGQAHMKMESKTLCMSPNGCAANEYLGAVTHQIPFNFALPRFPKRTACNDFKTECAGFIAQLSEDKQAALNAAFDCDGEISQTCEGNNVNFNSTTWSCQSSLNGLAAFPEDTQLLANMSKFGLDGPAFENVGRSSASSETLLNLTGLATCDCPYPLEVPEDPDAHGILPTLCCAERCEGTMFVSSEVDSGIMIIKVTSTMGFLFGLFVTVCWGVTANFKLQPLVMFVALCLTMTSLGLMIGIFGLPDSRGVWCKDNTQHKHQEDGGTCLFQSVWLIYWTFAGMCFWLCLVIDTFLKLVKGADTAKNTPVYHAVAWIVPFIPLASVLGTHLAGYEARTFWCLIGEAKDGYEAQKTAVELGVYYGGIVAIWAIGFALIQVILLKNFKKQLDESAWAEHKHIVIMCVLFSLIMAVYWGFKYIAVGRTDDVRAGAELWIGCLLSNFAGGVEFPHNSTVADNSLLAAFRAAGTGCGETYPYAPGTFVLSGMALFVIGLQAFLILQALIPKILKPSQGEFQSAPKPADVKSVDVEGTIAAASNPTFKH